MAVIDSVKSSSKEPVKKSRDGHKRSDLIHRVKYNNTLPDIPFDPKFIAYPFDSNRFVHYHPTSLEHAYKYELLTEYDLGVKIDLINPDAYKILPNAKLHPDDALLLEEDGKDEEDQKRSRHHNKNVSWLRKTEYISTEYNRFKQSADKQESRIGYKKNLKDDMLYRDRQSQLRAIEDTFTDAEKPITEHFSKPGVVPVEIKPIFPDFQLWRNPFAQVLFDSDPSETGPQSQPNTTEEMSEAMIRGMVDENGEQFVAYFLPTKETMEKTKPKQGDNDDEEDLAEDQQLEYKLSREYNWNVKNKASKGYEETFFFVYRDDGVYYNELETRVRLSKRRKIGQTNHKLPNSKLVVTHRELTEDENNIYELRKQSLETLVEEEDPLSEPEEPEAEHGSGAESDASVASSEIRRQQRQGSNTPTSHSDSDHSSQSGVTSSSEDEEDEKANRDAAAEIFGSSSDDDADANKSS